MYRVVVTGMGMVTALGENLPAVWRRLLAGENGIAPISFFDASEYSCKVAAEVKCLQQNEPALESIPVNYCRRGVRLFLQAVKEAYGNSELARSHITPSSIGITAGTSVNYVDMELLRHYYRFKREDAPVLDMERLAQQGKRPENTFYRRLGDLMSTLPAKILGITGPNASVDSACAASAFAIGEAFRLVQRGKVLAMIAGGASALVRPIGMLAFSVLGALSRNPDPDRASCPFDIERDGFVMGEGAGAVILENLEHAQCRGAKIYGELVGFGSTLNGHNLTDPSPDGVCEENAMRLALQEASLPPKSIDYVAAHGTSTPKNDATETLAIKRLFGDHAKRLLVSSNKGQIGHTISAAGVCSFIFALKAMNEGCVPPTMHYRHPDPKCDLDYVPNKCRPAEVKAALVNAFAFGGQNATLVIQAV